MTVAAKETPFVTNKIEEVPETHRIHAVRGGLSGYFQKRGLLGSYARDGWNKDAAQRDLPVSQIERQLDQTTSGVN